MGSLGNERLYGYTGKLLRIDLTSGEISEEATDPKALRKLLGGVGYAAKLLYEEIPAGIDPLGPANKLLFTTGPLSGTTAPGSGFAEVCCKSPQGGAWGESKVGGEWGGTLRKAGYDYLMVAGAAREPVYIALNDGESEIRKAGGLKGKTVSEKNAVIWDELGDKGYEIAAIGPAGEGLVRYASIMVEGRAFGRCGAGAVMGSKNLLAIAVKGSGEIAAARPAEFIAACKAGNKKVLDKTGGEGWAPTGTAGDIPGNDQVGDIPTKNWRSNTWGKGEALYNHFEKNNLIRPNPCYKGCVLRCGRIAQVKDGKWQTPEHEGCEYESLCAFTFYVLSDDMDAAVHATWLCNEYGMDTISAGAAIAFAIDCLDEGILSRSDMDGLDLDWGKTDAIVAMVHKIARREGIGSLLGEGVRHAARKIGRGSEKLAIEVKGMEGAAHDGRSGKALAVMYGTVNRGMCHIHGLEGMAYDSGKVDFGLVPYGIPDPETVDRFDEKGKGRITKTLQDFGILSDVLGICKFYCYCGIGLPELSSILSSLTGWDISDKELLTIGDRVHNLQRMFNVREGIGRADDLLPERCRQLPEFGEYTEVKECAIRDYEGMLDEYYTARGWDKAGIPTRETLKRLELADIVK